MRRILCGCLIGGLVGSGWGFAWSQEQVPFARRPPSAFAPETGPKSAAGAKSPARRSYYAELFGANRSNQPAAGQTGTPAHVEPQTPFDEPQEPPTNVETRSGSLNLTPSPEPATAQPAAPAETDEPDEGVIYAEFEQDPFEDESSKVIQVRGQRIVRPARRTRDDESALTQPIAIPEVPDDVEPLFEAAPASPEESRSEQVPARSVSIARPQTAGRPPAPADETATPSPAAPNIRVAWNKQGEVSIGRECRCQLVLNNVGAAAASNLEVVAIFSPNVRLLRSEPAPASNGECLVWEIEQLPAGGRQTIEIVMLPLGPGEITTQAEVRFSTAVSGSFQVAEPKLALKLSGPPQTMLGDSATQTILITNPGTGVADNVQISAVIPSGLEHARGGELLMELGALHPGETRSVRLPLAAVAGGEHIVQVEARAEGGLVQQASCAVSVIAPQLSARIDGPALRYLGRRATYKVLVTNDGSVPSENVRVMHKAPEGFAFQSADQGGQFDNGAQLLTWFVGRLEPGQTSELSATFECEQIGQFTHFIRATSDQGAISDSHVSTIVEGTALLSMSVRDLDDPIETGADTAYEIEIKNEGSAPAKHVQLSCELPESMTLVDVAARTAYRQAAGVLSFAPIEQLQPGETTTMRVHVRSATVGNLRFRAQLTSESVQEPLIEEELTKFYAE